MSDCVGNVRNREGARLSAVLLSFNKKPRLIWRQGKLGKPQHIAAVAMCTGFVAGRAHNLGFWYA
jgi:hypothetical protein